MGARAGIDVEAVNDRLAREHPIDDYYGKSPPPIRLIERRRLAIIRDMVGASAGLLWLLPRARATAVDVSDVFLGSARRSLAGCGVSFVNGGIDTLDLPAASFDRMVSDVPRSGAARGGSCAA